MKIILLMVNFVLAVTITADVFHIYELTGIQRSICYFSLGLLSSYNLVNIIKKSKKISD